MRLLHYYVQLGWKAEEFIKLDLMSRAFYSASMQIALEDRKRTFEL